MRRFWFLAGMLVLPLAGIVFWAMVRREYHAARILLDFDPEALERAQEAQAIIDAGRWAGTGCYYDVSMS